MRLLPRSMLRAALAAAAGLAWQAAGALGPPAAGDAAAWQAARAAYAAGDEAGLAALIAELPPSPGLEDYAAYWLASLRLRATPPDNAPTQRFLADHASSVLSDRLRGEWLLALAAAGDFASFDAERRRLILAGDDPQLACYLQLVRYTLATGAPRESLALEGRRLLATTPEPAGDGCTALAGRLLDDAVVSPWARLQALLAHHESAAALKLAERLPDAQAEALRQLTADPAGWLSANPPDRAPAGGSGRALALLALLDLARDDPQGAAGFAETWDPVFTAPERGIVWGRIGRSGQLKLLAPAHDWFLRGGDEVGVGVDYPRAIETLESRARADLRHGSIRADAASVAGRAGGPDWADLRRTIERMPAELRSDPAWVYWDARALQALGRPEEARAALRNIAGRFSFYGRLAAESLGLPLELPAPAAAVDALRVDELAKRGGFQRSRRLFELGLREEATREWSWELRGMDDESLHASAELARRFGVLDRMIASSERMHGIVDLAERYPMPYPDLLSQICAPLGMEASWVYGLIRQESRFMEDVRSNAGAIGLMQLMPATARYVAHRIGLAGYRSERISEVGINLRLGTEYLRMVLDDQGGQALLASAAYNAGPRRVRHWRETLAGPLEGALFVETIPIHETRDYVKRVLFNTVVYGALLQRPASSLQALLAPVSSELSPPTDLP